MKTPDEFCKHKSPQKPKKGYRGRRRWHGSISVTAAWFFKNYGSFKSILSFTAGNFKER
jgi:hypothetical protein